MSDGKEILPSFWSRSYFTLAPGESMEVTVSCPSSELTGESPVLKLSGWNVPVTEVGLRKN
jgi:exo-1,4-beta-D-glucosaminidase